MRMASRLEIPIALLFLAVSFAGCSSSPGQPGTDPIQPELPPQDPAAPVLEQLAFKAPVVHKKDPNHRIDALVVKAPDVAEGDRDGDGLSDLHEAYWGTDPDVADTDGDGISDGGEANSARPSVPYMGPVADRDRDGIPDLVEQELLGTSYLYGDSDGDGFCDGFELFHMIPEGAIGCDGTKEADLSIQHRDPRIPHMPVVIAVARDPMLNVPDDVKEVHEEIERLSEESAYRREKTRSQSSFQSIDSSLTITVETNSDSTNPFANGIKTNIKSETKLAAGWRWDASESSTSSVDQNKISSEEWQQIRTKDWGAATVQTSIDLINVGTRTYAGPQPSVVLNARVGAMALPTQEIGLGAFGSKERTLGAGDTITYDRFIETPISFDEAQQHLYGAPITVAVSKLELGIAYQQTLDRVEERTATFEVFNGQDATLRYISVPPEGAPLDDLVKRAFSDDEWKKLRLDQLSGSTDGSWQIQVVFGSGSVTPHDALDDESLLPAYDGAHLRLRAGDHVQMSFGIDEDGDGLTAPIEALWGTSDQNADSDADGLADGLEVLGIQPGTSGLIPLGEDNGWVATNPMSPDTDGDGLDDKEDPEPTVPLWWLRYQGQDEVMIMDGRQCKIYRAAFPDKDPAPNAPIGTHKLATEQVKSIPCDFWEHPEAASITTGDFIADLPGDEVFLMPRQRLETVEHGPSQQEYCIMLNPSHGYSYRIPTEQCNVVQIRHQGEDVEAGKTTRDASLAMGIEHQAGAAGTEILLWRSKKAAMDTNADNDLDQGPCSVWSVAPHSAEWYAANTGKFLDLEFIKSYRDCVRTGDDWDAPLPLNFGTDKDALAHVKGQQCRTMDWDTDLESIRDEWTFDCMLKHWGDYGYEDEEHGWQGDDPGERRHLDAVHQHRFYTRFAVGDEPQPTGLFVAYAEKGHDAKDPADWAKKPNDLQSTQCGWWDLATFSDNGKTGADHAFTQLPDGQKANCEMTWQGWIEAGDVIGGGDREDGARDEIVQCAPIGYGKGTCRIFDPQFMSRDLIEGGTPIEYQYGWAVQVGDFA